jgi:hypothetical protein
MLEFLTAVLLKMHIFLDATPCRLVNIADVSKDRSAFIFSV